MSECPECERLKDLNLRLLTALVQILPHAKRGVEALKNERMNRGLHAAMNRAMIERAEEAIAKVKGGVT